jgi:hypothetical protein
MSNYLNGTWLISGYSGSNIVSLTAMFDTDGTFRSKGKIWNSNSDVKYENGGRYIIDADKSTIYAVENGGSNSIYILDVVTPSSFVMYNPNSMEYYKCVRS